LPANEANVMLTYFGGYCRNRAGGKRLGVSPEYSGGRAITASPRKACGLSVLSLTQKCKQCPPPAGVDCGSAQDGGGDCSCIYFVRHILPPFLFSSIPKDVIVR